MDIKGYYKVKKVGDYMNIEISRIVYILLFFRGVFNNIIINTYF